MNRSSFRVIGNYKGVRFTYCFRNLIWIFWSSMSRKLRVITAGGIYHVLNRRVGRLPLFDDDGDYIAFEKILGEVSPMFPVRVLAYCLMPNHWHLVLWPERAGAMSDFLQRLTLTHVRRWHAHRQSAGEGPIYQGRFKSFPIQDDGHFLTVARYVERNPLRANFVRQAQNWRWSSLHRRVREISTPWLAEPRRWPVVPPRGWMSWVNRAETPGELEALRKSVNRGAPFGDSAWQRRTAEKLKLHQTLRDPWRPRKGT
jgi:putative transposase